MTYTTLFQLTLTTTMKTLSFDPEPYPLTNPYLFTIVHSKDNLPPGPLQTLFHTFFKQCSPQAKLKA